jgi:hypothetical protein
MTGAEIARRGRVYRGCQATYRSSQHLHQFLLLFLHVRLEKRPETRVEFEETGVKEIRCLGRDRKDFGE